MLKSETAIKAPKIASVDDDPEEVDISQHASFAPTPSRTPNPQNDPLAAAMLQMQQQQGQGGGGEDPMLKMMQQMMGSMGGGDPNDPNAQQDLPPMLKAMMNGAGGGQQQETAPTSGSAYVWRIVHAVFAFGLAFYICLTSTFNGTKLARSSDVYTEGAAGYGLGPRLFVIFTSVELVLQSTRYFVERGQLQGGGMFASIVNSGFIPEPYANYIRVAGRYITIARTIFTDVMVIVFVLGCMAWWKGLAAEA